MDIKYSRDNLLTPFGIKTLKDRYMIPSEVSPQDAFARAATAFADDEAHAQRLYDYVSRLWFMFSTPLLSNGGTKRGLPISCFLNYVPDSRIGITGHFTENAFLTSEGGGLGGYWGAIRSLGEATSGGSESTGLIPFIKVVDSEMLAFSQGKTRRGSYAAWQDIKHPEIEEFLDIRKPTGGDINRRALNIHHGVVIPDEFMEIIKRCTDFPGSSDDWPLIDPHSKKVTKVVSAKALWIKIIQNRHETGEPYIMFGDTVNKYLPQAQKDLGLIVNQSNLCVAPETKILTDSGYYTISDLENEAVNVWNGYEFSPVVVKKTGSNQELIKVTLSNGTELECTPYHKFYIQNTYSKISTKQVEAKNLVSGDKLIKIKTLPVIEGVEEDPLAYVNGFYSSDGCYDTARDIQILYFYSNKKPIADYCSNLLGVKVNDEPNSDRRTIRIKNMLKPKFTVPHNGTVKAKLAWLAGVLDGDGTLTSNSGTQSIQLASIELEYLKEVQLLLQTLGINSKITVMHEARATLMPDHKGGSKLYDCKKVWRLLFGEAGVQQLISLGYLNWAQRVVPNKRIPNREASRFVTVESVEYTGRTDDTYCFTEPKRGLGIFNGILTGQCSEITLPTDEFRTAVCCLSSVNLEEYDAWKDDPMFIPDLVRMLDNAIEAFIKKAGPEANKAKYSAMMERSIGLGAMGFHSYLQKHMIPFESAVAKAINRKIFKHIKSEALRGSQILFQERGPCPDGVSTNTRNMHLLAIAPNASSSIICGDVSPSIEPFRANAYTQKTMTGSFIKKNEYLESYLDQIDMNEPEVWSSIISHRGSVQHLGFIDSHAKDVFKTAIEIDQRWVIDLAADRTPEICQSQSLNLFVEADVHKLDLHLLHLSAWEKGCKTLYYLRSEAGNRADNIAHDSAEIKIKQNVLPRFTRDENECLACEG